MVQQYNNPFVTDTFNYPREQRVYYERYTRSQNDNGPIDEVPFERYVDLWFAGLALAAKRGLTPIEDAKDIVRSTNGAIFNSDPWRIQMIMLIAIAFEGDVEVVRQPRRMLSIANRLAAAGVPLVVEMLTSGDGEPIWNLSDGFESELNAKASL